MIADEIKEKILNHIQEHFSEEEVSAVSSKFQIEIPDSPDKGDLTCNIALMLGNITKSNPREVGVEIGNMLEDLDLIRSIEVAGPGFINIFLNHSGILKIISDILNKKTISKVKKAKKIQVEFVSANPTGPLHVGHGRGAIYGDVISKLLEKKGHQVQKEYYVNDAGRQIDILTASVFLRALNIEDSIFPESAYKGKYISEIAKDVKLQVTLDLDEILTDLSEDQEKKIDEIISRLKTTSEEDWSSVKKVSLDQVLSSIEKDLKNFGVTFDNWFLESSLLGENSKINSVVQQLNKNNLIDERDGNTWFKSSDFGDDKDRVLIRADGRQTYFASDVAYHKDKLDRGFDEIINVWGSDHHGYIKRVEASLEGLGYDKNKLFVKLVQFANLIKNGSPVKMSTRSGEFYSLEDLLSDVGSDVARFYYLSKQTDQHLDFDLDLAVSSKKENMYYYIQYAHARISSLEKKAGLSDFNIDDVSEDHINICSNLIHEISKYPNILEKTCSNLAPHLLIFYLKDLASVFHNFYNDNKILDKSESDTKAILLITHAVKEIISDSLELLGVKALDVM
tara:strand:- start:1203 stop:2900 length:1698 start_codon:yes stop_codon:yes gene_type:complete